MWRHGGRGLLRRFLSAVLPHLPDRREAARGPQDVPPAAVRLLAGLARAETGGRRVPAGDALAGPGHWDPPRAQGTRASEATGILCSGWLPSGAASMEASDSS